MKPGKPGIDSHLCFDQNNQKGHNKQTTSSAASRPFRFPPLLPFEVSAGFPAAVLAVSGTAESSAAGAAEAAPEKSDQ